MRWEATFDVEGSREKLNELEKRMASTEFWTDAKTAALVNREASIIRDRIKRYERVCEELDELDIAWEFIEEVSDIDEGSSDYKNFVVRLELLVEAFDEMEIAALLADDFDKSAALVSIHAGAGGTESHACSNVLYVQRENEIQRDRARRNSR